jgi:tetratricopeptide (TPR) repeat protein
LGQTDAAQRYYEQALALAKKLADLDGSDVQFQRDVSVSCDRLGDLQLSLGQTEAAQWYYNQASAVTQKLIDIDGANTQFQRDLAVNLNKLGNLQLRLGQADKAQRYYELALATREKLASLDVSNTQYQRDVAGSHAKLGEMYISQGGWSFACQHLMAVVDTLKSMQTAGTLMPNEQKHPLADHLAKLAWCQQLNNQFSESLKSAEESVAIVPVTGPCAAAMKLAHACLFNDRYEEATAIYQKYSGLDFEDGRKWNDELRSDFKTLRAAGQDHPEMKKIEAMLDEQAKPR